MRHEKVVIIGGGRLGSAVARGLVRNGYPIEELTITQRNLEKRTLLQKEGFRVISIPSNYAGFGIVIIAVKARDVDEVLRTIGAYNTQSSIIISAATGVSSEALLTTLNNQLPLFRAKFSILAEVNQEIIPVSLANPSANLRLGDAKSFLSMLGDPYVVPEAIMDMSGWELSSLPGVIVSQMIKQRVQEAGAENAELTEKLFLSGIRSLLAYLEEKKHQGNSLSTVVDELRDRIATPRGANDTMVAFLQDNNFWSLVSQARKVYQNRIESLHRID